MKTTITIEKQEDDTKTKIVSECGNIEEVRDILAATTTYTRKKGIFGIF